MRIAYVMSRFPVLTETFILYEMLALQERGVQVEVYPLLHEPGTVVHPEAAPMIERAHYRPFLSIKILRANWQMLRSKPKAYARVLLEVLRGTWGNANYFLGGICIFPKAVAFAVEMQAEGIDHVHAHFSNHPVTTALIINRLSGIPFSFTAHGHDLHINPVMVGEKTSAAAFAVTISEYNRKLMCELCGETAAAKIHVLHCGVDASRFVLRPAHTANGSVRIACIAALIEVKGLPYLLDACAIIKQRGVHFHLDIVGKGPDRPQLEKQIAELGLQQHVRLCGPVTYQEIAQLLSQADIAVQPSVWTKRGQREGIPVALMEAMATGVPVIASRLSGIPELVQDGCCGLLVPPRDSVALADAMERLARDPQLRQAMGVAGHKKVMAEFNRELNAERLLKLIEAHSNRMSASEVATADLARVA